MRSFPIIMPSPLFTGWVMWKAVLSELVKHGQLEKIGAARSTKYVRRKDSKL